MSIQAFNQRPEFTEAILDAIRDTECNAEFRQLREGESQSVRADHSLLVFVSNGRCTVDVAGKSSTVSERVLLITVAEGSEVEIRGESACDCLLVHLIGFRAHPQSIGRSVPNHFAADIGRHEGLLQIDSLLRSSAIGGKSGKLRGRDIDRIADCLFLQMLMLLVRSESTETAGPFESDNGRDERLLDVINRLASELSRPWTLTMMARLAGLSRSTFSHRFRALTGESPVQYLIRQRIELARRLLSTTTLGIAEIAERVGYETSSAFSHSFKKATGISPADFRNEHAVIAISSTDTAS